MWDFTTGTMDRNPPANARDTGSIPGLGRFHVLQLSLCTTAIEPMLSSLCTTSPEYTTVTEACVPSAHAPQQEKSLQ